MQTFSASCLAKDIQSKLLEIWETQELANLYWNKMKFDKQIKKTQKSAEEAVAALKKLFPQREVQLRDPVEIYRDSSCLDEFVDLSIKAGWDEESAVANYEEINSEYLNP